MSHTHTDLAALAQAFAKWRSLKAHRFEPIPADLTSAALQLRAHYSVSTLIKHLKLSGGFFKKAFHNSSKVKPAAYEPDTLTFVPFAVESPSSHLTSCQINKADGSQLVLTAVDPLTMTQVFLCSPSAPNPSSM